MKSAVSTLISSSKGLFNTSSSWQNRRNSLSACVECAPIHVRCDVWSPKRLSVSTNKWTADRRADTTTILIWRGLWWVLSSAGYIARSLQPLKFDSAGRNKCLCKSCPWTAECNSSKRKTTTASKNAVAKGINNRRTCEYLYVANPRGAFSE